MSRRGWSPLRWIDRIWHVRGSLPLADSRFAHDPFAALAPVFEQRGTTLERAPGQLVFHKDNPDAQDKLAAFEHGRLSIEPSDDGPVLRYDLTSHPLLWCFLAPIPFAALAFAVQAMRIQGYSFAGIFAALYLAGRWIEQRQVRRLLRAHLLPAEESVPDEPVPA